MANMEVRNLFRFTAVRPMLSHSKWDIVFSSKFSGPSVKSAQTFVKPS